MLPILGVEAGYSSLEDNGHSSCEKQFMILVAPPNKVTREKLRTK